MAVSGMLSLFSVEVLDTRFEPSADEKKRQQTASSAGPPRWKTLEFYLYAVVFAVAVPSMLKAALDASSVTNANYPKYEKLLQQGWILGRKVDNSDLQYSSFRNNFPYLLLAIGVHLGLRKLASSLSMARLNFDVIFSIIFLGSLHGVNLVKILIILAINYRIAQIQDRKTGYVVSWVFGISVLFANELLGGYPLVYLHRSLGVIDSCAGLIPRWDVHFNFTMLRMISFNVDYFEANAKPPSPQIKQPPKLELSEKLRIETPMSLNEYNFRNYLAYTTYAPLYLAGPIVTFNDFMYQAQYPLKSINYKRISTYAVRFLICLLTMELLLHYTYVVAISQTRAWTGDTPFQISMIALFNLNIIWLKLLLPWRLFRLWGLLDGIDSPENMVRCVNNNYSALSFWRSWHRSYNRWILRYVYIPLGGSKKPILNSLAVFTFVALWHDIQLRLLLWGWLVVIFILPEIVASFAFPSKKWAGRPIYRHVCAIGAVANIWMMMIANLVGFCVGLDGIKEMLHDMVSTADGLKYVIASSCCLFVGVQVMFEFREREKRMGINMRC
jgi:D-alanyl-lipoteichoic acid acyltransferase DltB (MBOAT superfamily)